VVPYVNVILAGAGIDALWPSPRSVADSLTDAEVNVKLTYSGLHSTHQGPIPWGTLLVPSLVASALTADESGESDLSRERLASQRLRLLHYHSKLFKKDVGRWPAELEELDGYIDFSGHPELLELKLSAKKKWSQFFSGLLEASEDEKEDDEDGDVRLDTDLYVIEWRRDAWTIGYKPGTFEHLQRLYIDEGGRLHRVEQPASTVSDSTTPGSIPEPKENSSFETKQPTPSEGDEESKE
jgi:hypothetical protein